MSCLNKKIKLDDSSPSNWADQSILKLNDDCFHEIISYFDLQTICRLGATCIRLNNLVQRYYSQHNTLYSFMFDNDDPATAELMIKQIGNHVNTFIMESVVSSSIYWIYNRLKIRVKIIKLILKYCSNLKEFSFTDSFTLLVEEELLEIFESAEFQNLQSININFEKIEALNFFVTMKNLKHFEFHTFNFAIEKLVELLKLRNLDTLSLDIGGFHVNYEMYSQIFDKNLELKKLHMWHPLDDQILNLICDKLIYLENFNMISTTSSTIPERTMLRIGQLKYLKHFVADWIPKCLVEILVESDNLESFHGNLDNPEDLTKFTKLKYLRTAYLNDKILNSLKSQRTLEKLELEDRDSITATGLLKFISGPVNLNYLMVSCSLSAFDEDILERLKYVVKSKKSKLVVHYDYLYYRCDVDFKRSLNLHLVEDDSESFISYESDGELYDNDYYNIFEEL